MRDTLQATPQTGVDLRAGRREWIGLAVLALPTLLVSIDIFVMLLALLVPARAAFTSGLHVAAAISAIILVGVALLVVTLLRNVRLSGEAQASEPDSAPADVPGADHEPVEASVTV